MPDAPTSKMADELRSKAHEHPTFVTLVDQLDESNGAPGQDASEGLYVDTRSTPGITVNGELRVSVARIHSVTEDDVRLVGQVQAVRVVDHPLTSWELRFYVHVPQHFHTNEFEDTNEWFLRVQEIHYNEAEDNLELAAVDA
jgi:hypothetical protein